MHVRPLPTVADGGNLRVAAEIDVDGHPTRTLWYEVVEEHAALIPDVHDHFAVATVMLAMAAGEPLQIHGRVDAVLLANLHRYQHRWVDWAPDRYHQVDVVADEVVHSDSAAADGPRDGAVVLFSGGVDATWTANAVLRDGKVHPTTATAVMVRGMGGFQLPQPEQFVAAHTETSATARGLGIELITVTTNWEPVLLSYGLTIMEIFATGFLSCLHAVSTGSALAVIASGYGPVENFGVSSSPECDPLLSSSGLHVLHHGAGRSRADKLSDLHEWGTPTAHIRVCNQPARTGRNCGTCEKCVRTALACQVADIPIVGGIPEPTISLIRATELHEMAIRNEWQILAGGIDERTAIAPAVRRAIRHKVWLFDHHVPTRHQIWRGCRRALRPVRRLGRRLRGAGG